MTLPILTAANTEEYSAKQKAPIEKRREEMKVILKAG